MKQLNITLNGHSWAWIAHLANKYNLELSMTEATATMLGSDDYAPVIAEILDSNPSSVCEVV